jgi:hypothetical protein
MLESHDNALDLASANVTIEEVFLDSNEDTALVRDEIEDICETEYGAGRVSFEPPRMLEEFRGEHMIHLIVSPP